MSCTIPSSWSDAPLSSFLVCIRSILNAWINIYKLLFVVPIGMVCGNMPGSIFKCAWFFPLQLRTWPGTDQIRHSQSVARRTEKWHCNAVRRSQKAQSNPPLWPLRNLAALILLIWPRKTKLPSPALNQFHISFTTPNTSSLHFTHLSSPLILPYYHQ